MAGQRITRVDQELGRALEHVARADDLAEFAGENGHNLNPNTGRNAKGR